MGESEDAGAWRRFVMLETETIQAPVDGVDGLEVGERVGTAAASVLANGAC